MLHVDDVVLLEEFQSFAQRRPGNVEPLRQLRLGRELVAGLEPLRAYELCNPVPKLDCQGSGVTDRFVHGHLAVCLSSFLSDNDRKVKRRLWRADPLPIWHLNFHHAAHTA